MTGKLNNTLAELGSEAARRLLEANRQSFDSALLSARTEAAEWRARLSAFETSTSWRLTRPIRWAIETVRMWRHPAALMVSNQATAATATAPLPYEDWIVTEEANCIAALEQPGPGRQAILPQRLGLVLLATSGCGPALTDLLADCPGEYSILVLDQDDVLPSCVAEQGRVLRKPIPPGFAPADAVGLALDVLDIDMLCFLDGRDRLAPGALSLVADTLAKQPQLDLLFADEDWLDAHGRRVRPFFKPGWNAELQRGRDLVGPFAFFRTALVRAATAPSGPAWLYDLANQVAAATTPDRIHHVPAVLCHRTAAPSGHAEAMRAASAAQLRRDGVAARIESAPDSDGWHRVIYDLPQPEPLVSIIVATRDHAELLRACADGVLHRTTYPRLELLIVDNGTAEPDALALLDTLAADGRVQVLRQPGPFNWSALNNAAAARAAGEVLVLLNNDIAVLEPDWLTVLVSHAMQPGIGAVGAKLLYPDGRVQHAGLTTDQTGIPRHLFRYASGDEAGAFGLLGLARDVWAVTGACLAIARDVFFGVGGLNEGLPVAYNDVDLCLRLTAHGYRIVWTPWSLVEHRELASRPPDHTDGRRDQAREELDRLRRDWGYLVLHDPFLNQNLHLMNDRLCFRRSPRHCLPLDPA
jgi:O-antigen biosynthesis protein